MCGGLLLVILRISAIVFVAARWDDFLCSRMLQDLESQLEWSNWSQIKRTFLGRMPFYGELFSTEPRYEFLSPVLTRDFDTYRVWVFQVLSSSGSQLFAVMMRGDSSNEYSLSSYGFTVSEMVVWVLMRSFVKVGRGRSDLLISKELHPIRRTQTLIDQHLSVDNVLASEQYTLLVGTRSPGYSFETYDEFLRDVCSIGSILHPEHTS